LSKYRYLSTHFPNTLMKLCRNRTILNILSLLKCATLHQMSLTLSQYCRISDRPCVDPANKSRFLIPRSSKFGFSTRPMFKSVPDVSVRPTVSSCTDVRSTLFDHTALFPVMLPAVRIFSSDASINRLEFCQILL